MDATEPVRGALLGLAVGDALGLPVEFQTREELAAHPIETMVGYGSFHKPPGTWSDDSSLTFCLAESLCHGFDLEDLARRFVRWIDEGYWAADGSAFDVGRTTLAAIARVRAGTPPEQAGGTSEDSNGNGSLMRILPLAFYLRNRTGPEVFAHTHQVSAVTHAHPVSLMACGIYLTFALELLRGWSPRVAWERTRSTCRHFYDQEPYRPELSRFSRVLEEGTQGRTPDELSSGGYVVHTLEAALWCFWRHDSYRDTVLEAVNLGQDTDTTAAVAGGLAGLYYGSPAIPPEWVETLSGKDEIEDLVQRFARSLSG